MKKTILTLAIALCSYCANAQWTTSGNNIYNSNTGNVGIGSTDPQAKFEVFANGYPTGYFTNSINTGIGQVTGIEFQQQTSGNTLAANARVGGAIKSIASGTYTSGTTSTYASSLALFSAANGTLVEAMRILSNGNVGIGTTSPAYSLDVNGVINAPSLYRIGGSKAIELSGITTTFGSANSGSITSINSNGASTMTLRGGNVGIGNTNPSLSKLSVAGSDANTVITTGLWDQELSNSDPTTNNWVRLGFNDGAGQAASAILGVQISDHANNYGSFNFWTRGSSSAGTRMTINSNGNIGIGTTSPDQKLTVNGTIHSNAVRVDTSIPIPDYVFEPSFKLPGLPELKAYLDINHHLPDIPSATEIEKNGLNLGEMNLKLLKKVEELTLYVIDKDTQLADLNRKLMDQDAKLAEQHEKIKQEDERIAALEKALQRLTSTK